MYQPELNDPEPKYPSFKTPSGNILPGIGAREMIASVAVLIAGLLLVAAAGRIQVTETSPLEGEARAAVYGDYVYCRDVLFTIASEDTSEGLVDNPDAGQVFATEADREHAAETARKVGFDALTGDAELEGLIPSTETVVRQRFRLMPRIAFLLVMPLGLYIGLVAEIIPGTSIRDEFKRYLAFRRMEKRVGYLNPYVTEMEKEVM